MSLYKTLKDDRGDLKLHYDLKCTDFFSEYTPGNFSYIYTTLDKLVKYRATKTLKKHSCIFQ